MRYTTLEHVLHSLCRLKNYRLLIVSKKVIICFRMSILKENKHLTVKLFIRYCEV